MAALETSWPEMPWLCMELCKILDPPICDEYAADVSNERETSDTELLTISDAAEVDVLTLSQV